MKTEQITAIKPDSWKNFEFVQLDHDTYTDSSWSGCDYRITSGGMGSSGMAMNVRVTGRKSTPTIASTWQTRAVLEFVGDGEPSTFLSGIVYSKSDLFEVTE